MDDGVAVTRHPGIFVQPVQASAKHVEPELVAGCAAERPRDEHALPRDLAGGCGDTHRDVVDLAFENRRNVDRDVDEHQDVRLKPDATRVMLREYTADDVGDALNLRVGE